MNPRTSGEPTAVAAVGGRGGGVSLITTSESFLSSSSKSLKDIPPEHNLSYKIHKCSSSSSTYTPENILEDRPSDQASRWSSDSNSPPQYIILKLDRPAIVNSIIFGKYEKTHVCNLKRFKIYGGFLENNFLELLDSGLKNDSIPETFALKTTSHGKPFPCLYIKIVPIQSWGPIFNFSIWHVGLIGQDTPQIVNPALNWQEQFREEEAIRLCLKHFRQRNYLEIFEALQRKTQIELESPLLSELHNSLVQQGNFENTEALIVKAIEEGLFDVWINSQQPSPKWNPLILPEEVVTPPPPSITGERPSSGGIAEAASSTPNQTPILSPGTPEDNMMDIGDVDGPHSSVPGENSDASTPTAGTSSSVSSSSLLTVNLPTTPGPRGGHQMVIDNSQQAVYLFGGWDGYKDLNDFWVYDIGSNKWKLLSNDTEVHGGPSPRSCHKMVLDPISRYIFILGRYLERGLRDNVRNIKSDFYMYDIDNKKWISITDDTGSMNGPNLIFDHQMCVDYEGKTIYVFGGSSLFPNTFQGLLDAEGRSATSTSSSSESKKFSGLYSYHIPTNTWKKLLEDGAQSCKGEIRSRSSHSMLFHSGLRKLFIFGGQRKRDEYLNDFFTYDVDNEEIEIICNGNSIDSAIPAVGHTQRATIDVSKNEIHVMTGLNKEKDKRTNGSSGNINNNELNKVSNSFWVYNINLESWTCFYRNENNSTLYWNQMQNSEPRPRYAHQLVYNESTRTHYMFGGNPGGKEGKEDKVRLGDFWSLYLVRPSREEVLRRCRLIIRKVKFSELASDHSSSMNAMSYLQNQLSSVVDHNDDNEERDFQLLASELFKSGTTYNTSSSSSSSTPRNKTDEFRLRRSELFDRLSGYFRSDMTQPRGNLVDLIHHEMDIN